MAQLLKNNWKSSVPISNFISAEKGDWHNGVKNGCGISVYDVYISNNSATISIRVFSSERYSQESIMDEVKRILDDHRSLHDCQLGYRSLGWEQMYYNTIDVKLNKDDSASKPYTYSQEQINIRITINHKGKN